MSCARSRVSSQRQQHCSPAAGRSQRQAVNSCKAARCSTKHTHLDSVHKLQALSVLMSVSIIAAADDYARSEFDPVASSHSGAANLALYIAQRHPRCERVCAERCFKVQRHLASSAHNRRGGLLLEQAEIHEAGNQALMMVTSKLYGHIYGRVVVLEMTLCMVQTPKRMSSTHYQGVPRHTSERRCAAIGQVDAEAVEKTPVDKQAHG